MPSRSYKYYFVPILYITALLFVVSVKVTVQQEFHEFTEIQIPLCNLEDLPAQPSPTRLSCAIRHCTATSKNSNDQESRGSQHSCLGFYFDPVDHTCRPIPAQMPRFQRESRPTCAQMVRVHIRRWTDTEKGDFFGCPANFDVKVNVESSGRVMPPLPNSSSNYWLGKANKWTDASRICGETGGAKLVEISTKTELDHLMRHLISDSELYYFVGAFKRGGEVWLWDSTEDTVPQDQGTKSVWYSGEPNGLFPGEHYSAITVWKGLMDVQVTRGTEFICECINYLKGDGVD